MIFGIDCYHHGLQRPKQIKTCILKTGFNTVKHDIPNLCKPSKHLFVQIQTIKKLEKDMKYVQS